MPSFQVQVDHQTDRQSAISCLRQYAETVRQELAGQVSDVSEQWDDDGNLAFSFSAMGMTVSGQMRTCEQQVSLNGKLPFAAIPFRGMIEQKIAERLRLALESRPDQRTD